MELEMIWDAFNEGVKAMHWQEWIAFFAGIVYVILAAKESVMCWIWGIISCTFWAYATFVFYELWLDAILQVFYVIIGFVGLYQWKFGGQEKDTLAINRRPLKEHLAMIGGGLVLSVIFAYFFATYTPAAATHLDALTTVFSMIATLLVVKKALENWLYWIVIDFVYLGLYWSRGAYLFALLMLLYIIIAIFGYFNWKKELEYDHLRISS